MWVHSDIQGMPEFASRVSNDSTWEVISVLRRGKGQGLNSYKNCKNLKLIVLWLMILRKSLLKLKWVKRAVAWPTVAEELELFCRQFSFFSFNQISQKVEIGLNTSYLYIYQLFFHSVGFGRPLCPRLVFRLDPPYPLSLIVNPRGACK